MNARRFTERLLYILGILALLGVIAVGLRYHEGLASVRGVTYELEEVSVRSDDTVSCRFRIDNLGDGPVEFTRWEFSLYINGEFLGSNTDRSFAQVVPPGGGQTLIQTLQLRPLYQERLADEMQQADIVWTAEGRTRVVVPNSRSTIFIHFRLQRKGR